MEVRVPFLKQEIGAGDAVKAAASAVGIEQKRGCGCAKRQAAMNQKLKFVPKGPRTVATAQQRAKASIWDTLPEAPEGWERVEQCDTALLFRKTGTDQHVVWSVKEGRYVDAHAFCCDPGKAIEEHAARCR
jgi:hypothetical protein